MKKITTTIISIILCMAMTAPAFAYNYDFESGGDTLPGFGRATSNDDPVPADPMGRN